MMKNRMRPIALAALIVAAGPAFALPQGAKPTFGQTRVTQPDGSTLLIEQATPRAGIDWASFSIGSGETVRVQQPGASSVLFNRVTGMDPSVVLGRLQSNGRVFLTNPRGVIFGQGAQVDVGGLVATTLKLGDADAQAGRWSLTGDGSEGSVVNRGRITADGGTVALVAPQVRNEGQISAARVALGAASEVQVDLDGDGLILFNARAADAARLDQLGSVQAGRAEFIAAARGQVAGTVLNLRGQVQARGFSGQGGEIVIDGGPAGIVEVGSAVDASSATGHGGDVLVLGQKVLLDSGARIDASGATGGGRVRVGGDFQGANPDVRNSEMLNVAPGAVVDASARVQGDGGQVVLWSDQRTRFYGHVLARGGAQGGDGGHAEVSGKQVLEFRGSADLTAPHGTTGRLLLDPLDITIDDVFVDTIATPTMQFTDNAGQPVILAGVDINLLLATTSVDLQATRDITITTNNNPFTSATNALSLRAGNNILIDKAISTNGLTLSANDNGANTATGSGRVVVTAALNAGAGTLAITNNGSSVNNQLAANLSGATLDLQGGTTLAAAQTWNFSGNSFVTAALSGNAALTLAGTGSLMLTGSSAGYNGNINVNAGRLIIAGFNPLGTGTLTVASGARLDVDGAIDNAVTLAAGATLGTENSAGAQFSGTVTLAGDVAIDGTAGDVALGIVAQSGAGRAITTQGVVGVQGNATYTGATTVSNGTLTLDGTSQSTAFNVNGGTLALTGANQLLTTAALQIAGAAQVTSAGNQGVGTLNGNGTLALGAGTFTVNAGGTFNGIVSGAGSLGVAGGTLTLGGANTYLGSTTVSGGTLVAASTGALGSSTTGTTVASGGTLQIGAATFAEPVTFSGSGAGGNGAVVVDGSTAASAAWTMAADATIGGAGSLVLNGGLTEGAAARNFTKAGSGTLTLATTSGYTGSTTVAAGTLVAGAANALPPSATTVAAGATLQLQASQTIGGLQGPGTVALGSSTLTAGAGNAIGVFGGSLTGSGTLVKTGSGTLTLNGSNSHASTDVQAGTLVVGAAERLADTSTLNVGGGGAVQFTGSETVGSFSGAGTVNINTGAFTFGTAADSSFSGSITGGGVLVKAGSGIFTLSGTALQTGGTDVAAGTLRMGAANRLSSAAPLAVNGGTLDLSGFSQQAGAVQLQSGSITNGTLVSDAGFTLQGGTVTAVLAGGGTLTKTGSGSVTLSTANTYGGATTVSSGTLVVTNDAGLGASTAGTTVTPGATLELSGVTTAEPISFAGTGSAAQGAVVATGTVSGSGTWTLSNDATLAVNGTLALAGSVGESRAASSLTKTGAGTLTLGGTAGWTGSTTLAAGPLVVGGGNALPSAPISLAAGTTLTLQANETVGALSGAVGSSIALGANTLTVGADGGSSTYSGGLDGSGNLVKAGGGSFTLAGNMNATGSVTVGAGTMVLPAPLRITGASPVIVNSGAALQLGADQQVASLQLDGTLNGSGKLTAATYALNGGTVGAGAALGAGALTSTGSSTLQGTVDADVTISAGTLTLGSAERIADTAALVVASGATLQLGGNERVGGADLRGTVTGVGTLSQASLLLSGGTYDSPLVANSVLNTGNSTVNATIDTLDLEVRSGSLLLGAASRLLNAPAVTVGSGATLTLGGNETVGSLAGAGSVQLGAASLTTGGGASTTFSGSLAGAGTLVKAGTSTFTLNGINSHGATVVQAGVLTIGDGSANSPATLGSGPVTNNATLRFDRGGSYTLANTIGGTGGVQFDGGASVSVTQANTYSGGTDIASATVALGSATPRLGSGTVTLAGTAATLDLSGGAVLPNAVFSNGGVISNTSGIGTVNGAVSLQADSRFSGGGGGLVFNGTIADFAPGFGVTTTGTVTFTADNAYNGITTVSSGTLNIGNDGATGTVGGGPISIGGTLHLNRSNAVTVSNTLAGSGNVVLDTPAGVTLAGANTFSGSTQLNSGTLSFGAGAQSGSGTITLAGTTLDIANGVTVTANVVSQGGTVSNSAGSGTLAGSLALASDSTLTSVGSGLALTGTVSGAGGITKGGSGRVELSGANTFGGAVTVAAGTLAAGHANALGGTAQGTTVQNGAALEVNGVALAAEPLSLAGGGVGGTGALLGSGSVAGPVTLAADASIGGNVTVNGAIGGAGRALTKVGSGTVTLAGANTYSGATTVGAGTLALGAVNAITGSAVVVNGGTLDIGSFDNQVPSLQLLAGQVNGSSGVLGSTAALDARQGSLGALLSAGTGLAKSGTGTVTLTRSQPGTGSVTVSAGTLDLGSFNLSASSVSLQGGSIAGSGTLTSASTFDLQNGSIAAGLAGNVGVSKTTAGSVTLSGAGRYTGSTAVQAGTLALVGNDRLPDGSAVQVAAGATLALGGNDTVASLALQGTLGGSGRLTAATYAMAGGTANADLGAGALTSSGSSTINGQAAVTSVNVASGRLTTGAAGRFSASPTVTLPAASELAIGGDEAVGTLTGSGIVVLGSARLSAGAAADFTFDGQFSGAGGFAKTGAGTMVLSAAQSYGGSTEVLAGTLRLPTTERLPDTTALAIGSGATLKLDADETVASATIGGTLLGPGRLNAARYALAGGTVNTDLGSGVLTSTGASLLNGTAGASTVDVLGGTLTLGSAQRLATTAAVAVQPGATLRLTGDQTVQTLDLSGTLTGSGTFTASNSYLLNAGSQVDVPLGAGTLNVDGNATLNQVAGATVVNVNSGTLTVAGTGDLSDQAAVNVAGGGTLAVNATQTVATLTLAGNVAGGGTLAVNTLQTEGAASVQTTVQVATPVTVTSGTLTVGDGATGGALVAPSTTVGSSGTLAYNRSDTVTVGNIGGTGTLRQEGSGTLQLAGNVSGIQTVQVGAGNLALSSGNQLNDTAAVSVARNGTLTLAGSGDTVGTITVEGRLAGSGATLVAGSYTLAGGTVDANLGSGTLTNTGGASTVSGTVGAGSVSVSGGSLAVAGSQALLARPALDVQAGATLTLAGTQTVGVVTNAGTLVTGSALDATRVAASGAVRIGGSITTTGDQTYGGALTSAVATPQLVAGGDIVALAPGNDFNGATLAVQAHSLRLYGGGSELRLGPVALAGGESSITAGNRLVLSGATTLAAGGLTLQGLGTPGDGAALASGTGQAALLPDPANGAASGTRLVVATPVISQTAEGTVTTAAGTTLRLRAPAGGSIELNQAGNHLGGTISAVSGPGGGFTIPTGQASVRLSRVQLNADTLQLAADDGSAVGLAQAQATTGGDAVRADLVQLRAAHISTAPGAWIRARLPYSVNQGPNTSAPGLVIDTGMAPAGGVYGSEGNPLAIAVNPSALGLGGLLMSVWPEPAQGGAAAQKLYFGCSGCAAPVYLYGGDPLGAQAFFNGSVLGTAPLAASVINNSTTLLENARRTLFEGAVRTENVAPRLRAGVIAEVGVGRPATEGAGGAKRPELCDAAAGTLDCGAAR